MHDFAAGSPRPIRPIRPIRLIGPMPGGDPANPRRRVGVGVRYGAGTWAHACPSRLARCRWPRGVSNFLQNRIQVLAQRSFDQRLAANRVVVKDDAIAPDIER